MKNSEEKNNEYNASLSLAVALIALASLALWFCQDISRTGIQQRGGVGPRAFPIGLSVCLLAGGIAEAAKWLWDVTRRRTLARQTSQSSQNQSSSAPFSYAPAEIIRVLLIICALAIYIPAISWLGFSLSSWLFAFGMLIAFRVRWYSSLIASTVLVAGIKLLFYYMFKVQLPDGVLNLPL